MEGLKTVDADLSGAVVPVTIVIILALFMVQRFGTAAVARLFGPVMLLCFTAIGVCGIGGIARAPQILLALSPVYAVVFLVGHFRIAFIALAAVVLAVTGAEALYADMGHFGRRPISLAWLLLVFPASGLSYLGQGAIILEDHANATAPFFMLTPDWGRIPMIVLATAATVIASQAVISGAFCSDSPSRFRAASLGRLVDVGAKGGECFDGKLVDGLRADGEDHVSDTLPQRIGGACGLEHAAEPGEN